ncbi:MAG: glycine cleavage T C-terminal barrel domain-containing protein, partial [Pseudomonadota bacterium]
MDRWIDWQKPDFNGRDAAITERDGDGPAQVQVTRDIDALDADATGYEPVWVNGEKVGFITSGAYGHTVQKSLAMALVNKDVADVGTDCTVHIVGVERPAKIIAPSPYDPKGSAMRG